MTGRTWIPINGERQVQLYSTEDLVLIERRMRDPTELGPSSLVSPVLESESLVTRVVEDLTTIARDRTSVGNIVKELENCRDGFYEIMRLRENDGVQQGFDEQMQGYRICSEFSVASPPVLGKVKCPFTSPTDSSPDTYHGIKFYDVTRVKDNTTFKFSDFGLHLVKQHHFFGGIGSYVRIDPQEAIDFFGLER
jgi:hypothetical protein